MTLHINGELIVRRILMGGQWFGIGLQVVALTSTALHLRESNGPLVLSVQGTVLVVTLLLIRYSRSLHAEHVQRVGRYEAERKMSEIMLEKMREAQLVEMSVTRDDDEHATTRKH